LRRNRAREHPLRSGLAGRLSEPRRHEVSRAAGAFLHPRYAKSLAKAVGLRDILVNEYEEINDRLVWEAVPRAIGEFRAFLSAMGKVLGES